MQHVDFNDQDKAERFFDAMEVENHEYVAMIANTPTTGMYRVKWGEHKREPQTLTDVLRDINSVFDDREMEARQQYDADCALRGREIAADESAAAAGLTGREARVYSLGFSGASAKFVNPRAEGLEQIFRAGRLAWATPEGQRAARAAAVRARSIIPYEGPSMLGLGL
ncbi:MAG: hypothetical protein CVU33_20655 [Betaproteobacteria bacterium HGW-Betaproteobacteria-6]|jgi:hypothetical protein|nr:MAG: hypothetical protein CVU33_20655 [Betaproteobacteria bacterium HGW-Betaproteobacteria-6]